MFLCSREMISYNPLVKKKKGKSSTYIITVELIQSSSLSLMQFPNKMEALSLH